MKAQDRVPTLPVASFRLEMRMGERHSRFAALLAAAWEAEVVSGRELAALAHRATELSAKARLLVLSAYCRAHASRLLARLSTLGRGPLPVPPEEPSSHEEDPQACFARLAARARVSAARYETMAEIARRNQDLSSAWICELNRSEEQDLVSELSRLAGPHAQSLFEGHPKS